MNSRADVWTKWRTYWFTQKPVIGLSLFRIAFAIAVLIMHVPRFRFIAELYTKAGFMFPDQIFPWLHVIVPLSLPVAYAVNGALLFATLALLLGYRTRTAALIGFLAHSYLTLLEHFSAYSIPHVIAIYFLLFVFSDAGTFLSVEAKMKTGRWAPTPIPRGPRLVQELMVWQLASMYVSNALHKAIYGLKAWGSGHVIFWALQDPQWGQLWAGPFVRAIEDPFRALVVFGFFFFLIQGPSVLIRQTRPWAILFGLSWHWITLFFTKISPAWLAWVSIYILLIEPTTLERNWELLRARQLPVWKIAAVLLVVLIFVFSAFYGRSGLAT